ncbi:MAG: hypothetical protein JWO95_3674, partial [Verrucomicrobiales bacterium]|nr:hypothetical protein [Verrucomicrobiales bacterium]
NLAFQTATGGVQIESSNTNNFTYSYSTTGTTSAHMVVTFKADKRDVYDITFTADTLGSFVRNEFRNSVLNDTDAGTFTRTPAH